MLVFQGVLTPAAFFARSQEPSFGSAGTDGGDISGHQKGCSSYSGLRVGAIPKLGGLYGHLGGCAIYSETTVFQTSLPQPKAPTMPHLRCHRTTSAMARASDGIRPASSTASGARALKSYWFSKTVGSCDAFVHPVGGASRRRSTSLGRPNVLCRMVVILLEHRVSMAYCGRLPCGIAVVWPRPGPTYKLRL